MLYAAKTGVKLSKKAVKHVVYLAKNDENMSFSDIENQIKDKFNLTDDEAKKAVKAAEIQLVSELL